MKFQTRCTLTWAACAAGALLATQSPAHAMGKSRKTDNTVTVGEKVIRISDDVPSDQAAILKADLGRVSTMNFPGADAEMLRVMGLDKADSSSLSSWLGSRVGYVISENFDIEKNLVVVRENVNYPYAGEMPDIDRQSSLFGGKLNEERGTTVMSNIGTALYLIGKQESVLAGVKLPGIGTVAMTSPRVGVVQIGEGLMSEKLMVMQGAKKDSQAHQGMRLSVYFHEARHSDGHGKSLGFVHAICPAGHAFEGAYACDRNLNGPYTVGAFMSKAIAENCGSSCSAHDSEVLSALTADSFDRVIHFTPASDTANGARRELYVQMLTLCRQLKELGIGDVEGCSAADIENYRREIAGMDSVTPGVASTNWDPASEGLSE